MSNFPNAKCAKLPLPEVDELFFSENKGRTKAVRKAEQMCNECDRKYECRDVMVMEGITYGIFGGTTLNTLKRKQSKINKKNKLC